MLLKQSAEVCDDPSLVTRANGVPFVASEEYVARQGKGAVRQFFVEWPGPLSAFSHLELSIEHEGLGENE